MLALFLVSFIVLWSLLFRCTQQENLQAPLKPLPSLLRIAGALKVPMFVSGLEAFSRTKDKHSTAVVYRSHRLAHDPQLYEYYVLSEKHRIREKVGFHMNGHAFLGKDSFPS